MTAMGKQCFFRVFGIFFILFGIASIPNDQTPNRWLLMLDTKSLPSNYEEIVNDSTRGLPWVHSWNDASRMATIQNLVEEKTFIIDQSLFTTGDKYFYNGHFYSDKPPFLALFGAFFYSILYALGINFANYPKLTYYLLTLFSIGTVSAMGLAVFRKSLEEFTNTKRAWANLVTLLVGIGTLILPYSSLFNNHIVSGALLFIGFYFILHYTKNGSLSSAVYAGFIFSLAGCIDITCFLFVPFVLLIFSRRSLKTSMIFILSCLPLVAGYFTLNLILSGSLLPPALNASLWQYPGSHFDPENLSGLAGHKGLSDLVIYTYHMILGNRGLLSHSPILIFSPVGFFILLNKESEFDFKFEYATFYMASLLYVFIYVARTVDYSGSSFGVRWFTSIMLLSCFSLAFTENWVRSSRIRLSLFGFVSILSIVFSVLGSYSAFTLVTHVTGGEAHLAENTILASLDQLRENSSFAGKARVLAVGIISFFLLYRTARTVKEKTVSP